MGVKYTKQRPIPLYSFSLFWWAQKLTYRENTKLLIIKNNVHYTVSDVFAELSRIKNKYYQSERRIFIQPQPISNQLLSKHLAISI